MFKKKANRFKGDVADDDFVSGKRGCNILKCAQQVLLHLETAHATVLK